MTSPHGRLCTTTFGSGAKMALGKSCTTCSVAMCGWLRASTVNPVLGSWIVNRSKPPNKGGPRLRYPQTRQRPQTPYPCRYVRVAAGGRRHGRQCARPQWGAAAAGDPPAHADAVAAHLGGRGVCRAAGGLGQGAAAGPTDPLGDDQALRRPQGVRGHSHALANRDVSTIMLLYMRC
jgi:hypothetical protein